MEEMTKHGHVGLAAMRAGVDRKTARKYMSGGKLPSELVEPRDWKTREDPFVEHWPEVEALLSESPGLEAKTLFELLVGKYEWSCPGSVDTNPSPRMARTGGSWSRRRGSSDEPSRLSTRRKSFDWLPQATGRWGRSRAIWS